MTAPPRIVFLLHVDNTLLDDDPVIADLTHPRDPHIRSLSAIPLVL